MHTDRRSARAPAMLVGAVSSLILLAGCSDSNPTGTSRVTAPRVTDADQGASYTTVQIDYPGATFTAVNGINSLGDMVGRYIDAANARRGFLLDHHGAFTSLDFPGGVSTSAVGINALGDVAGEYSDGSRNHGFMLRSGAFTAIDLTDGVTVAHSTFAFGVNALGAVVGEYKILFKPLGDPGHAFLFENGKFTHISPPGARAAVAWGINASGQSVGYYMDQQVPSVGHGWRRGADGTYEVFDFPGASFTNARAINESGTIVGVYRDTSQRSHGFVLEDGAFTQIDYPGAIFTRLSGINARGDIVGDFQDAGGRTHSLMMIRNAKPTS
jgi:uncharacterized membrane protein